MIRNALAILLLIVGHAAADTITLRPSSAAGDGAVTLGAVAELDGDRAKALAGVALGELAAGRNAVSIDLATVRDRLTEAGAHWGKITLRGPRQITVRRAGSTTDADATPTRNTPTPATVGDAASGIRANPVAPIDLNAGGRTLRQVVHAYIHARHDDVGAADLRVVFNDDDDEAWTLTDAAGRFELEPTDRDLLGRVPIRVRHYAGDQLIGEHRVTVNVTVRRTVVVARRPIERRQTITSEDVALETRWIDSASDRGIGSINEVLGMTASRRVRAGEALDDGAIEPRRLVQRGQLITVRAISGGLVLKTVGRAMEDGYRGQLIEVRSDRTRQTFRVRVSGPQAGVMLVDDVESAGAIYQGGQS